MMKSKEMKSKLFYYFCAEGADITRVLLDLEFLDDSSEGSTVSGTVFTNNSDFDGSLSHFRDFICRLILAL